MMECVDGEYQAFKAKGGKYVRDNFFGKYPQLKEMVASMTDADIWKLNRGGHDPHKVYAAYHAAMENVGTPTVIITKTIKGYGMGKSGESINTTHQQKKLDEEDLLYYRDRFDVPLTDQQVKNIDYFKPDPNSEEIKYLKKRREALGGSLPKRSFKEVELVTPKIEKHSNFLFEESDREYSTTTGLVRSLGNIMRDKEFGKRVVPIVADEARTFGMANLFSQIGIYSPEGQLYEPEIGRAHV